MPRRSKEEAASRLKAIRQPPRQASAGISVKLATRLAEVRIGRIVPVGLFTLLAARSFLDVAAHHHAPAVLVVWPAVALAGLRWPALGIIGGAIVLRLGFADACCTDQIAVSHAAWERVSSGMGGPYGVGYAESDPPGAPFPYGPLGLVWWLAGPVVEFAAAVGIMAVLASQRALITLAIFAAWAPSLTMIGINDYSPSLLILLGLMAIRSRPMLGAATLAVAAALKPYAFAWFLPAVGYAGLRGAAVMAITTAILWSPLFIWWGGIPTFLETIRLAARAHPEANALNLPTVRWVAVPLAVLSLFARRWDDMVILGSAAFMVFLFLDRWASDGYWIAVIPILGLALERRLHPLNPTAGLRDRRRGDSNRARWATWLHGPTPIE
jgi:hypothetical protein